MSKARDLADYTGLQGDLAGKVDDSQVLTNVPSGAVFTDTTYTVGDGGLTEINFTTALNTKLGDLDQGVATTDSPTFADVTAVGIVDVGNVLRVGANNSEMGNHYFRFKSTAHAYFDHSALGKNIIFRTSDATAFDSSPMTVTKDGITVTGIVTTGLVDGRNVATDGTKLDGIEAGATADQTAAEIRTLVESASDSNVFTDADHTKLNNAGTQSVVTTAPTSASGFANGHVWYVVS